MKRNRKTLFAVAVLAAAAVLMLGLWYFSRPGTQAGHKTIVVQVVHADETSKDFTCRTSEEYLGPVLVAEQLVEGEQGAYGLFITAADGERAQDSLHQFWCVTKGGERVDTGVDKTPIADGDHFELTLSTY